MKVLIISLAYPPFIGGAELVFQRGSAQVRRVTSQCVPDPHYGPEVGVVQCLDAQWPGSAPHNIYACYARAFTVIATKLTQGIF